MNRSQWKAYYRDMRATRRDMLQKPGGFGSVTKWAPRAFGINDGGWRICLENSKPELGLEAGLYIARSMRSERPLAQRVAIESACVRSDRQWLASAPHRRAPGLGSIRNTIERMRKIRAESAMAAAQ